MFQSLLSLLRDVPLPVPHQFLLGALGALQGIVEQAESTGGSAEQMPGSSYSGTMGPAVPAVPCCAMEWLAHSWARVLVRLLFS